jgi:16S rRNA (guanine527-N7)-methyltransferase
VPTEPAQPVQPLAVEPSGPPGSGPVGQPVVPEPPAAAAAVFGATLPAIVRYAGLLAGPGVERGIVGPAEADRIWERHLLNCAAVAGLIPARGLVADLGSGAGLPGIVLALLRPECDFVLIESMARRTAFLEECVTALGLTRVRVVRGRAEDLAGTIRADIVTARAVAPLARLAGWAVGLCRPGGTVLAIKGAGAAAEVSRDGSALRLLGVTDLAVLEVGGEDIDPPATVVRFRAPSRRSPAGAGSGAGGRGAAGRAPGDSRGGRRGSGPGGPEAGARSGPAGARSGRGGSRSGPPRGGGGRSG